MPLSTEARHVVQNRIDYLRRRAGYVVEQARDQIKAAVEDIVVAKTLIDEAGALALELQDDARG